MEIQCRICRIKYKERLVSSLMLPFYRWKRLFGQIHQGNIHEGKTFLNFLIGAYF